MDPSIDYVERGVIIGIVRKWLSSEAPFPVSFELMCRWLGFSKTNWYNEGFASLISCRIPIEECCVADEANKVLFMSVIGAEDWASCIGSRRGSELLDIIKQGVEEHVPCVPELPPVPPPVPYGFPMQVAVDMANMYMNCMLMEDQRRLEAWRAEEKRRYVLFTIERKILEHRLQQVCDQISGGTSLADHIDDPSLVG